jgi:hypothetical protein
LNRGGKRPYHEREYQIPTWSQDFHGGELKSSWERSWNQELFEEKEFAMK